MLIEPRLKFGSLPKRTILEIKLFSFNWKIVFIMFRHRGNVWFYNLLPLSAEIMNYRTVSEVIVKRNKFIKLKVIILLPTSS